MEAGCNQCGARYQFDASSIPPLGYDAQCTQCQAVFFVQPPKEQESLITVACNQCSTSYQFSPSDIPEAGYDAQCTQCQAIFFVSKSNPPKQEPIVQPMPTAAAIDPMPEPAKAPSAPPVEPAVPLMPAPVTQAPVAEPVVVAEEMTKAVEEVAASGEQRNLIALHAELGEPQDAPEGASFEDDFEGLMRVKRLRNRVIGGTLVALPLMGCLLFFAWPSVFDATLGPLIGIKARIHPDAIALVTTGKKMMWRDTEEAYLKALKSFDAALDIDGLYPEALALAGLAHTFRGMDMRNRGQLLRSRAQGIADAIGNRQAAKQRPPQSLEQITALRKEAEVLDQAAGKLYEQGGDAFALGGRYLKQGLTRFSDDSNVVSASGIFLIEQDPDKIGTATKRLKRSLKLLGAEGKVDPNHLPDLWTTYLQTRILSISKSNPQQVVALLGAMLAKQPTWHRARYELVLIHSQRGDLKEAHRLAKEIVAVEPGHRVKDLISAMGAAQSKARAKSKAQPKNKNKNKAKGKKRRRRR